VNPSKVWALSVKPDKKVTYRKDSWRATQSLEKNFAQISA